jgi:hypothetical protein
VMVVEVDGFLHETQPERLSVEVEVGLRLVHGGGDVVQAENLEPHPLRLVPDEMFFN